MLLKPVEAGWKAAKSLIVVTNGALGELPLGCCRPRRRRVDTETEPSVLPAIAMSPWLARTHAVTVVPSASALVTLARICRRVRPAATS